MAQPRNSCALTPSPTLTWCGANARPEATRQSFDAQGFYKTGDVALVDERGLFHVVDRVKELIKVKGFQVAPAELEAALLGCEQIADAAVIGLPSAKHGEVPKAFVVRQAGAEGLTAEQVSAYLRGRVAEYKEVAAEHVEFVEAVPKSAAGKILRKELRKLEEARAAEV
jgi:acyl-CoA synthetase (AMP-forming)/AMP-acid ligase II